MIIVLERGSKPEQIAEIVAALKKRGLEVSQVRAAGKPVLHVTSGDSRRARRVLSHDEVEGLVATSGPRIRREGRRFFPYHFIQWAAVGIVMLAVLTLLAGQFPPGVGAPVDVQHPPADLVQPWYLRAPLAFVALFPAEFVGVGWLLAFVLAALVLLVPRFDRGTHSGAPRRAIAFAIVLIAAAAAVLPLVMEELL